MTGKGFDLFDLTHGRSAVSGKGSKVLLAHPINAASLHSCLVCRAIMESIGKLSEYYVGLLFVFIKITLYGTYFY